MPGDVIGTATITQKQPGVVFGLEVAAEVFRQAGADELEPLAAEGGGATRFPPPSPGSMGPSRLCSRVSGRP